MTYTPALAVDAPCQDGDVCVIGAYCATQLAEPTCQPHACGDGVMGPGEACEDLNDDPGDGCDACQIAPIHEGYTCDPSDAVFVCGDGLFCDVDTCAPTTCGDGLLQGDEGCDDGNTDPGDGCDADCAREPRPIEGSGRYDGRLDPDRTDTYTLTLDEGATLDLDFLEGLCGDMRLAVLGWDGAGWVELAADTGFFGCPTLSLDLEAGDYLVTLTEQAGDATDYALDARLTFGALEGEPCMRDGSEACEAETFCAMTEVDGVGVCTRPVPPPQIPEEEPNEGSASAMGVVPDVTVLAHLDVEAIDADFYDVFVLNLEAPSLLRVSTLEPDGGCAIDTRLYRIDPILLDAEGIDAAVAQDARLAFDDDDGPGYCSWLQEPLDAGLHYYLVDEYGRNAVIDYAVTFEVLPLLGEGERCDAAGEQNGCLAPLECLDEDANGDGHCR